MKYPALTKRPAARKPAQHEARRKHEEIKPRPLSKMQLLLGIDGYICADYAVGESQSRKHYTDAPPPDKGKAVETDERRPRRRVSRQQRRRGGLLKLLRGVLHRGIDKHANGCHEKRYKENNAKTAYGFVEKQPDGRTDGSAQVVGKAVVAYPLCTPRRGQHVDSHRAVGNSHRAEGRTVESAHEGKEYHTATYKVAEEKRGEETVAQ